MLPISTALGFPKEDVTRDTKIKPQYGLQVAQSIYSRWYNAAVPYGFANMQYFRMLREYAQGRQSTLQYKKRYRGEGSKNNSNKVNGNNSGENGRRGYNNISFDIDPVAPTFITIIKSKLAQSDYEATFISTTKSDIKTKEKMKWDLYAEAKFENPMREAKGLPPKQKDWYPRTIAELEIYEKYHGFRLPLETALTRIARHCLDVSKWKMMRDQYSDSGIETSFLVGRVVTNTDGSTGMQYIEAANFVTTYYDQDRQAEPVWAGHITKVQLGSIKNKLAEQGATDDDIRNLARSYAPYQGIADFQNYDYNSKDPVTQRYMWYDFMVDVLHFEWKTDDVKHFVGRKARNGNYVYKQEDRVKKQYEDGRERKTDTFYEQVIYEGDWIVGSKWLYDYGLQKNMIRGANGEVCLSYAFERIEKKSIVESWVSLLDDYQMGVLKLRAAVQAAAPKGFIVDSAFLAQMNGDKDKGLEAIRMRRESGNMVVNTPIAMLQQGRTMASAIQELEGGIGNQLVEWERYLAIIKSEIQRVAGLTDAAAALPNTSGEKGLGVTQQELNSTQSALYGLEKALINFKEKACYKLVAKTRLNIAADAKCRKYWESYLEPHEFEAVSKIADLSLNGIGIKMVQNYSQERKALILQAAMESMKAGKNGMIGISMADFMLVEKTLEEGYGELAVWFLTIAEDRARAIHEQAQSRMSQENAQNSISANQAAMQAKAQLEQMLSQLRMTEEGQKIAAKLEADLMLKEVEHQYTMQELALEGSIQASTNREVKGKI
jgi:hypothetical protein